MCRPSARAARAPSSTARQFKTGSAPGKPRHTGQVFEFGSSPNRVEHPQKIFDVVLSCACISRPMTASQPFFISVQQSAVIFQPQPATTFSNQFGETIQAALSLRVEGLMLMAD